MVTVVDNAVDFTCINAFLNGWFCAHFDWKCSMCTFISYFAEAKCLQATYKRTMTGCILSSGMECPKWREQWIIKHKGERSEIPVFRRNDPIYFHSIIYLLSYLIPKPTTIFILKNPTFVLKSKKYYFVLWFILREFCIYFIVVLLYMVCVHARVCMFVCVCMFVWVGGWMDWWVPACMHVCVYMHSKDEIHFNVFLHYFV